MSALHELCVAGSVLTFNYSCRYQKPTTARERLRSSFFSVMWSAFFPAEPILFLGWQPGQLEPFLLERGWSLDWDRTLVSIARALLEEESAAAACGPRTGNQHIVVARRNAAEP